MKKALLLLLTAALLAALVGCQTPGEEIPPLETEDTTERVIETESETETRVDTEQPMETDPETESETKPIAETEGRTDPQDESTLKEDGHETDEQYSFSPDRIESIEQFLKDAWNSRYGENENNVQNSQNNTVSMIVPVLKNSDFELVSVEEFYCWDSLFARWIFARKDREPFGLGGPVDVLAPVDPHAFDSEVARTYGDVSAVPYPDGSVYSSKVGWIVYIDGNACAARIPTPNFPKLEEVYEYLDFEIVTYSPTPETGAVQ